MLQRQSNNCLKNFTDQMEETSPTPPPRKIKTILI
uniref:Uncharacterized protein n=1 Tax=Rhizophora mucronata TaxID=61149 RepID=A0A2P2Q7P5_RHIMU